jgi:hypothetical protein
MPVTWAPNSYKSHSGKSHHCLPSTLGFSPASLLADPFCPRLFPPTVPHMSQWGPQGEAGWEFALHGAFIPSFVLGLKNKPCPHALAVGRGGGIWDQSHTVPWQPRLALGSCVVHTGVPGKPSLVFSNSPSAQGTSVWGRVAVTSFLSSARNTGQRYRVFWDPRCPSPQRDTVHLS